MDENNKDLIQEEVASAEVDTEAKSNDQLKEAIEAQMRKIQRQSMLIGAQTFCSVTLDKIHSAMNRPGKRTMNDYKRLIKDIEDFCTKGISRRINADGDAEIIDEKPAEETVQN